LGAKAEKKQYRNCTNEPSNVWTNLIQRDWTGYVVAGQQSAAKTSRNGNQKKQLTGEINWELEAIRSTQNSWKDELCAIDYAAALVV
jgi:hypothetical protein